MEKSRLLPALNLLSHIMFCQSNISLGENWERTGVGEKEPIFDEYNSLMVSSHDVAVFHRATAILRAVGSRPIPLS